MKFKKPFQVIVTIYKLTAMRVDPFCLVFMTFVALARKFGATSDTNGVNDVIIGLNWTEGFQIINLGQDNKGDVAKLSKMVFQRDIFVLPVNDASKSTGGLHHQRLPIVYYSSNNFSKIQGHFMEFLVNGTYPSEGVLLLTTYELNQEKKELFKNSGYSRAFFHYMIGASSNTIVRMQTFRHKEALVENKWTKTNRSKYFYPKYDFHGAKYTMLGTNNDYPFLYVVPHPNDPTLAANYGGTNVDCLGILSIMYNFTLEVRIQLDNNWGVRPVSGNLGEPNASYSGIYGSIINDKYDQSSSAFQWSLDRDNLFDFSVNFYYVRLHYMMDLEKASKPDWTLFMRPFHNSAWLACFTMVHFVLAVYLCVQLLLPWYIKSTAEHSLRQIAFIGWLWFLVVEVYYEGALTMFFTTKNDLPFNTIEEGLSLYPEYKLIMKQGNEYALLQAAQAGVKGMDEQLERMRKDPEVILREGPIGLLEGLKEPGTFTLVYAPEIRAIMKQHPVEGLTLQKIFPSKANNGFFGIIYPKRSPFKAAFDIGYRHMVSSGQIDHMSRRLPKEDEHLPNPNPKEQLDIKQTGLVFLLLGCSIFLALIILAAEITLRGWISVGLSKTVNIIAQ